MPVSVQTPEHRIAPRLDQDTSGDVPGIVVLATARSRGRLAELDSLRGLAAFAVSLSHVFSEPVGTVGAVVAVISVTPLHAFYDGHRAVLFFFVLSGFVLALPFFRRKVSPAAFVVKRAVRLYPIYLVVIAASIGAYALLIGDPHLDWATSLSYASMVGANTPGFDGVVWSLAHEMRISIVFPLLMIPVVKFSSGWILVASLLLLAAGFWTADPTRGVGLIDTVYYGFFFVLGAVVAKHIDWLLAFVRTFSWQRAVLWLGAALVVYGAMPFSGVALPLQQGAVGFAVVGIMLLGVGTRVVSGLLLHPILRFMGRISYSYYLLHTVVLTHVADLMYGHAPNIVIATVGIAASMGLAWAAYRWIEVPSIRLGQSLYLRISQRTAEPVVHVAAARAA